MSYALMKQPTPSKRVQPVSPCSTLLPITIAPLVLTRAPSGAALRVPENLAVARAQRHHVRVARRQEDLVVGDRDAADAAVARRLVRARARFPDQTARLPVERLHDVARGREIDDAVVHDRGRLIRARVVHRPHPLQLQVLHVGGRDLIQRAVAVALIIAPENQPVARRRILEHLRRDRHVVLHFARQRSRRGSAAPPRPPRAAVPAPTTTGWRGAAPRPPPPAARGCRRLRAGPGEQRVDRRFDARRQRLLRRRTRR